MPAIATKISIEFSTTNNSAIMSVKSERWHSEQSQANESDVLNIHSCCSCCFESQAVGDQRACISF